MYFWLNITFELSKSLCANKTYDDWPTWLPANVSALQYNSINIKCVFRLLLRRAEPDRSQWAVLGRVLLSGRRWSAGLHRLSSRELLRQHQLPAHTVSGRQVMRETTLRAASRGQFEITFMFDIFKCCPRVESLRLVILRFKFFVQQFLNFPVVIFVLKKNPSQNNN